MRAALFRLLLVLSFGVAVAGSAHAAPLAAYGKLPSIEAISLSPSGQALAFVVTNGEQRQIVVRELASGKILLRGSTGDVKVRSVQWADEKRLVIVSSATRNAWGFLDGWGEWFFSSVIDVDTKRLTPLMTKADADLQAIFGTPVMRRRDGNDFVFLQGMYVVGDLGHVALYRYDVATGSNRLVETGSDGTVDWVVGPDGEAVAQELYNSRTGEWMLKVHDADGWKTAVRTIAFTDRPELMGLGRDGKSVLYAWRDKAGWTWREARLDGREPAAPILLTEAQGPLRDRQDGRMIGLVVMKGDTLDYRFFDPEDARAWDAVKAAFGSLGGVTLESWSADRRKVVVRVDSPKDGPAFALVDLSTRQADWLGAEYVDLKSEDIGPQQPVAYKGADGTQLTGYLTLPRGREAKGLPLVVFPHGGPASRDTPGFDWWAQAMASRGYAVLQVNFRGSEGLGEEFLEAGYGQFGRKMQSDLSDGVRWLAAKGTIDPKRVCIVGASYGGYAALAGATIDQGVYRCAVSVAGPSDLRRMVGRVRDASFKYWTRFMGVENERDPKLAEISPAALADKVSIPILMIHGRDDTVVPLEQSQLMADALKRAGKPYELVVQKGADHWLSRGDTRLQTLEATVTFLEKHNPPT